MIGYIKHIDAISEIPKAHIFIDMIANETETEFLCDGESISLSDIRKHTDDAPPTFPCCDCQTVAASIAADAAAITEKREEWVVGAPKYKVGETVNYHEGKEIVAEIMRHPKGWLYTFESCKHLAVLESVLTGEIESACIPIPEADDA